MESLVCSCQTTSSNVVGRRKYANGSLFGIEIQFIDKLFFNIGFCLRNAKSNMLWLIFEGKRMARKLVIPVYSTVTLQRFTTAR